MFVYCVLGYATNCRRVERDEENTHNLKLSLTEDPVFSVHKNTTHK